jgi:hypothetical protein
MCVPVLSEKCKKWVLSKIQTVWDARTDNFRVTHTHTYKQHYFTNKGVLIKKEDRWGSLHRIIPYHVQNRCVSLKLTRPVSRPPQFANDSGMQPEFCTYVQCSNLIGHEQRGKIICALSNASGPEMVWSFTAKSNGLSKNSVVLNGNELFYWDGSSSVTRPTVLRKYIPLNLNQNLTQCPVT